MDGIQNADIAVTGVWKPLALALCLILGTWAAVIWLVYGNTMVALWW